MKYYLDTEFHEYKKNGVDTIELISIGIVCEDGREYYAISKDFTLKPAWSNEWLKDNVLKSIWKDLNESMSTFHKTYFWNTTEWKLKGFKNLIKWRGKSNSTIADDIKGFIGDDENVEFYAYYADYDWVVFCWLFGRMIDIPSNFPMYCIDLKQIMDRVILTDAKIPEICFLKGDSLESSKVDLKLHPDYPKQENEHNALQDAKWNMELHKFLNTL